MALDYSTLSNEELEAISNDDYSKLSDATLQAMAQEGPQPDQGKTLGEKTWGEALGPVVGAGATAYEVGKNVIKPAYEVAKNVVTNPLVDIAAAPWALRKAGEYLGTRAPASPSPLDAGGQKVVDWVKQGARAAAPEVSTMASLSPAAMLGAPYALAGMEAANIRQHPNAPGYKNVPYAQMYRGEQPTMNAAGVANQQAALRNMSTAGNPMPGTPEFAKLQQQYQDNQTLSQPADDKNFMARMTALSRKYLNIQ